LVHCSPQPVLHTGDFERDLIQMPFVANPREATSYLVGELLAVFCDIENDTGLVHCSPQPVLHTGDFERDLIQMPFVANPRDRRAIWLANCWPFFARSAASWRLARTGRRGRPPSLSAGASGSICFKGRRSTPGTIPAISQLDRLNSTTQISVEL
jgi:hypothetical protein